MKDVEIKHLVLTNSVTALNGVLTAIARTDKLAAEASAEIRKIKTELLLLWAVLGDDDGVQCAEAAVRLFGQKYACQIAESFLRLADKDPASTAPIPTATQPEQ